MSKLAERINSFATSKKQQAKTLSGLSDLRKLYQKEPDIEVVGLDPYGGPVLEITTPVLRRKTDR